MQRKRAGCLALTRPRFRRELDRRAFAAATPKRASAANDGEVLHRLGLQAVQALQAMNCALRSGSGLWLELEGRDGAGLGAMRQPPARGPSRSRTFTCALTHEPEARRPFVFSAFLGV